MTPCPLLTKSHPSLRFLRKAICRCRLLVCDRDLTAALHNKNNPHTPFLILSQISLTLKRAAGPSRKLFLIRDAEPQKTAPVDYNLSLFNNSISGPGFSFRL
jgi:hypothetical protein